MAKTQDETGGATNPGAAAEGTAGKAKQKRAGGEKPRRSHGERALASLRSASRGQRDVSEPAERARFLLAEANVLALLEVADALRGSSAGAEQTGDGGGAPSE